jgi:hypothetical protein
MIAITLQFKNIEAVRKGLAEIPTCCLVGYPDAEVEIVEEKLPAPKPEKPAKVEKAAAAPEVAPAPVTVTPTEVPAPAAAVEYPVLQKAVFTLAGKSRDAAAAVAASMGVKTFKELPADKWADALAAVNAKIAEL